MLGDEVVDLSALLQVGQWDIQEVKGGCMIYVTWLLSVMWNEAMIDDFVTYTLKS